MKERQISALSPCLFNAVMEVIMVRRRRVKRKLTNKAKIMISTDQIMLPGRKGGGGTGAGQ